MGTNARNGQRSDQLSRIRRAVPVSRGRRTHVRGINRRTVSTKVELVKFNAGRIDGIRRSRELTADAETSWRLGCSDCRTVGPVHGDMFVGVGAETVGAVKSWTGF